MLLITFTNLTMFSLTLSHFSGPLILSWFLASGFHEANLDSNVGEIVKDATDNEHDGAPQWGKGSRGDNSEFMNGAIDDLASRSHRG